MSYDSQGSDRRNLLLMQLRQEEIHTRAALGKIGMCALIGGGGLIYFIFAIVHGEILGLLFLAIAIGMCILLAAGIKERVVAQHKIQQLQTQLALLRDDRQWPAAEKPLFCMRCGNVLSSTGRFCQSCGARQEKQTPRSGNRTR